MIDDCNNYVVQKKRETRKEKRENGRPSWAIHILHLHTTEMKERKERRKERIHRPKYSCFGKKKK